jgi:hypothetical protein
MKPPNARTAISPNIRSKSTTHVDIEAAPFACDPHLLWLGDIRAENALCTVTQFKKTPSVTKIAQILHARTGAQRCNAV